MRIDRLYLRNFRNYREQTVHFDPECNVIFGENAAGKTNLLEAVLYLSRGKTPRIRGDRELISFDAPQAEMEGLIFSGSRDFQIKVALFRGKNRRIWINRVPVRGAAALGEIFHTVYFSPDDLSLVRSGAAVRRRFLDQALCQLRPRYALALSAYSRAYEQKTRILRDSEEKPDLLRALPDFNEYLIRYGAILIRYRAQYARRLLEYAASNHAECSGNQETLTVSYQTVSSVTDPLGNSPEVEEQLRRHMEEHASAERASRLCLSGPHKDDLLISINGRDARMFASQGQARTAALALKLAEREILKNSAGEYPILLLDDILSELDPRRQEFVLNRISGGQVLITCCEDDRLPGMLGGQVLYIRNGSLSNS
jgi:DNA replication and repair protein RecF